jgi:hypothetical protein
VIEQRPLRLTRIAVVELEPGAADLDTPLADGREPELLVLGGRLLGLRREKRDVVDLVLGVRLRRDQAEPKPLGDVEVRGPVGPVDVDIRHFRQHPVEVADSERHVLQRALLARALLREQRQLPAQRVPADERELVRPLDLVHPEPLGQELADAVPIRDPQGDMVEGLGPHPGQSTYPGEARVHYFLRLTAASSCRLFMRERPLMFRRFAWL